LFHFCFKAVEDKIDVPEEFEGGTEVDLGLVFDNGDDEKRGVIFQTDTFDGIGVPFFLVQREETFGEVLNVFGLDIFEQIDGDEVMKELDE
jgi:hypothetical protein